MAQGFRIILFWIILLPVIHHLHALLLQESSLPRRRMTCLQQQKHVQLQTFKNRNNNQARQRQPKQHISIRNDSCSQHFANNGSSNEPPKEGTATTTIATTNTTTTTAASTHLFTHADILWKIRPPPDNTSFWKRLWLRLAANLIRLDCLIFSKEPPVVLCPKGGQAVIEAYCYSSDIQHDYKKQSKLVQVGRFGFTTERGPSAPSIQETVQDLYNITQVTVGVGAIIFMVVEPQYRKRNIGALALQVISSIQALQGIDFTMLVVDDNGSGKLVDWYRKQGYSKAPKLQDLLGSPNAEHGITMIAPTNCNSLPPDCHIEWW
jgi:hypothetical protein